jgi:hypothetical protein
LKINNKNYYTSEILDENANKYLDTHRANNDFYSLMMDTIYTDVKKNENSLYNLKYEIELKILENDKIQAYKLNKYSSQGKLDYTFSSYPQCKGQEYKKVSYRNGIETIEFIFNNNAK